MGSGRPRLAGTGQGTGLTMRRGPAGCVITVAGPDGSGKTTFCNAFIASRFAGRHVRRFHHRFELLRARSDADPEHPHDQTAYPWAVSVAKLFGLYGEFLVGWMVKVRGFTRHGGCVVIERGWWDLAIDPVRYRLRPHTGLVRVLGRMLPRSDLLIVLEGTTELLMERKAETSAEEVARQTAAWREIVPSSVPRVYLDVSSPVDELVGRAADEIERVRPRATLSNM